MLLAIGNKHEIFVQGIWEAVKLYKKLDPVICPFRGKVCAGEIWKNGVHIASILPKLAGKY